MLYTYKYIHYREGCSYIYLLGGECIQLLSVNWFFLKVMSHPTSQMQSWSGSEGVYYMFFDLCQVSWICRVRVG